MSHCLLRPKAAFDAAALILWNRPYWDMRTNILDFVACLSILLNCVAMLYFNNDWFINGKNRPEPNGAVNLDNVLGVINGITVLLILSVFVVTIIEARFKASSARKLSSAVARMVVEVQQELSTSRDEFCILLGETDEKLQPLDAQTVADEVSFKQFKQAAERCMHGKTCPVILEAVFFVLKLINADDDVHSAFITSRQVREEVASARGVPRQLVRALSLCLHCVVSSIALRACSVQQIHEFLGNAPGKALYLSQKRRSSLIKSASSSMLSVTRMNDNDALGYEWHHSRVRDAVHKICWELSQSLSPVELWRWIRQNEEQSSILASLFCFAARLVPHIPDLAEIGAYSRSLTAKTYREAAERMPRILLMSAFGNAELGSNMKFFLEHLEEAEKKISDTDLELLAGVMPKDRGPVLYWMIKERGCRTCVLGSTAGRRQRVSLQPRPSLLWMRREDGAYLCPTPFIDALVVASAYLCRFC